MTFLRIGQGSSHRFANLRARRQVSNIPGASMRWWPSLWPRRCEDVRHARFFRQISRQFVDDWWITSDIIIIWFSLYFIIFHYCISLISSCFCGILSDGGLIIINPHLRKATVHNDHHSVCKGYILQIFLKKWRSRRWGPNQYTSIERFQDSIILHNMFEYTVDFGGMCQSLDRLHFQLSKVCQAYWYERPECPFPDIRFSFTQPLREVRNTPQIFGNGP